MTTCMCHWCRKGKPHPGHHLSWYRITHLLMKAESLDPEHSISQWACSTCGHVVAVRP